MRAGSTAWTRRCPESATRWRGTFRLRLPPRSRSSRCSGFLPCSHRSAAVAWRAWLELNNAYRGTAMVLGDLLEADDPYTGEHSKSVVDLAMAVGERLDLGGVQRRNLEFGALLHDVGKIAIPKGSSTSRGQARRGRVGNREDAHGRGPEDAPSLGGFMSEVSTDRPLASGARRRRRLPRRPRRLGHTAGGAYHRVLRHVERDAHRRLLPQGAARWRRRWPSSSAAGHAARSVDRRVLIGTRASRSRHQRPQSARDAAVDACWNALVTSASSGVGSRRSR